MYSMIIPYFQLLFNVFMYDQLFFIHLAIVVVHCAETHVGKCGLVKRGHLHFGICQCDMKTVNVQGGISCMSFCTLLLVFIIFLYKETHKYSRLIEVQREITLANPVITPHLWLSPGQFACFLPVS